MTARNRRTRPTKTRAKARTRRPRRNGPGTRNLKRLALCVVSVLLAGVLLSILFTSPYFHVQQTRVLGTQTIPAKDIMRRVNLPPQTNIFRLQFAKKPIAESVLTNPVVKDVRLYSKLPNILIVKIVERQPYIVLASKGKYYEIDSQGVPFRIGNTARKGAPLLLWGMPRNPILGRPVNAALVRSAMEIIAIARQVGLPGVTKITVDQNHELCLNVVDGYQVRLGRPEQLREKLEQAAHIARTEPGFARDGEYIDLTCPEAPAFMLRGDKDRQIR